MVMFKRSVVILLLAFAAFGQARSRLVEWALVLDDDPVARRGRSRAALRSSEGEAQVARVRAGQESLIGELRRRGVPVTGATQTLVNTVLVSATRETAVELQKLPGVKYVIRAPKVRPNLDRAV